MNNDITTLGESDSWIVCIDESYPGKLQNCEEAFSEDGLGVMACVVFPETVTVDGVTRPPLEKLGWRHCCEESFNSDVGDQTLDLILNNANCGVLALPAKKDSIGWRYALIDLLDAVLRLLRYPDGNGRVKVKVCVEPNLGVTNKFTFQPIEDGCKDRLRDSFPELAKRLFLDFEPLYKPRKDTDEVSYNAYPDMVANTCCMRKLSKRAEKRFARSGWSGVCFLDVEPKSLTALFKCFHGRSPLDEAAWTVMTENSGSGLIGALAQLIGDRARTEKDEWVRYLGYLDRHLKSGAIEMRVLGRQVDWMEKYLPRDPLDRRDELVWMTAKLALANHRGRLDGRGYGDKRRRFDELCAELFEEAAPLVCDAVLNLAVAYTNAFEFEMALALLDGYLGLDRALFGTSAYGKLLSSRGQHLAFLGQAEEAIRSFRAALDCFAKLSGEKEREINTDITRAYLTTVMMDSRPDEALPMLKEYLTGDRETSEKNLLAVIASLARGEGSKFHHHVLLRYIAGSGRDDVCRIFYRSNDLRAKWSEPVIGDGHPWEMIEFYRAFLVPKGEERNRHLENAYRIARQEGGETILVIAAVIAGAALAEDAGDNWRWRFDEAMSVVRGISGLQDAERGRLEALGAQPTTKLDGLELADKVLPFNFR